MGVFIGSNHHKPMASPPEEKISEEDLFKFWLRPPLRPAGPPPLLAPAGGRGLGSPFFLYRQTIGGEDDRGIILAIFICDIEER
ncbi:hypothetical protein P0O15_01665 [Methanotrichaceae archaeon Mx]|uniref:Uncharacterized protein n=1 Tax=Candidatus Methanocrinis natronophilus TaxID=3033396 RepID=A0ABT5X5M8_9EURY|nr:hypothetical protein [Candidatus Methanocrinis natronophilus]